MQKLRIFSKSGIIAILAIALLAVGVFAAYQLTKPVDISVNVVPSGDLLISPSELSLGDIVSGTEVVRDISFENTTSEPLQISWDGQIVCDGVTILNVTTSDMFFELASGASIVRSLGFTAPLDAPYGEYPNLTWTVYGITP